MSVDFKATQQAFSAYIKDPFNTPKPDDIAEKRIEIYRELFFNNIDSFLSSNFPVLKMILTESQWFELSQGFFAKHSCKTPYFSEIPEEFLDYLQNQYQNDFAYPFLLELAHYEWVEMALSISKEELTVNTDGFIESIEQQVLTLSPLAWSLVYQFPVHQISRSFLPLTAPETPTFLLVYRDTEDEVHFIQIPPITYRLLQILQENEQISCQQCLKQIATESAHPDPQQMLDSGLQIIKELAAKNIITKPMVGKNKIRIDPLPV